jgi:hypothetical protein
MFFNIKRGNFRYYLIISKIFLIFAIFFLDFSLDSCSKDMAKHYLIHNGPEDAIEIDRNASQDFKDGWRDGCEVGSSSGSSSFYKGFYKNNQVDGYKMANSKEYEEAWSNAFWFCYRADYVHDKGSIWGSYFGGMK